MRFYKGLGQPLLLILFSLFYLWGALPCWAETQADSQASLTTSPQASSLHEFRPLVSEGEQGIPLSELNHYRETSVTSDGSIPRILISLLIVLLTFLGLTKYGLPKLIQRFPQFFESLGSENSPSGKDKKVSPLSFLRPLATMGGEKFKVLATTPLGPGKALYLVQVKDRQLALGVTPQEISLLTEWQVESESQTPAPTEKRSASETSFTTLPKQP
jgi:flagellar biogenesis protein FliO